MGKPKLGRPKKGRPARRIGEDGEKLREKMLAALEKSLGVVTTATKLCGISQTTHYRWRKKYPEYDKKVIYIQEVAGDFVETKLYKLIEEGNVAATIFYAKTKLKNRGYVERQEITGQGGGDIKFLFKSDPLLQIDNNTNDIIDISAEDVKEIDDEDAKLRKLNG